MKVRQDFRDIAINFHRMNLSHTKNIDEKMRYLI